jgi:hypothetical protein
LLGGLERIGRLARFPRVTGQGITPCNGDSADAKLN